MKDRKNIIIIVLSIVVILLLGIFIVQKTFKEGDNIIKNVKNKDKVKIRKNEVSKIELEDYKTNEFSIKKPKGWKVDTLGDYIHYTIKVYDPNNESYQFFLNMKTEGYNKSEDAKQW